MHIEKINIGLIALLGALAFSSLNTKAMGLAWVVITLTGLWALIRHVRLSGPHPITPWIRIWVMAAVWGFVFKTVPLLYWSDPWVERHGEIRLLLGAAGIWGLLQWRRLDRTSFARIADALTLSSALGLIWVVLYGRSAVTTHPIPWAGALAMISACLLAMALQSDFPAWQRKLWLAGGSLAVMAVLASQSRGAYGIVLWWMGAAVVHAWKRPHHPAALTKKSSMHVLGARILFTTALVAGLWALSYSPIFQRSSQSIQEAIEQIRLSDQSIEAGANSSVGARLYMWTRSIESIQASPWIGLGHDGRKKALAQWAEDAKSTEIKQLGHVHNEYLNQMIDHGLWGLASQLVYLLAWAGMIIQLRRARHAMAALSLGGIAFVHFTSSFSNVNFSHNYYTAALSLFISLSLWMVSTPEKALENPPEGKAD